MTIDLMPTSMSSDVGSYNAWKDNLRDIIGQYQHWLQNQKLLNPELSQQLAALELYLQQDKIKLAFVGEFSRGKTELINALFFASAGRRLLPSHVGRTTMCPTEIFFDEFAQNNYLRLLAIDTRKEDHSLQYFLNRPECWHTIVLDPQQPEQMAAHLKKVTETRVVTCKEATALGFDLNYLDASLTYGDNNEATHVIIPAWRHALIHFDHPLLRQGLSILDTPGLNALGCEPDLTLKLLPECQGVIFMLNADAGVTSTDLQIWQEYIANLKELPNVGLFAVLNKIDSLWDDLDSDSNQHIALAQLRELTAKQLKLGKEHILPLSAKQGLLAKVSQNMELYQRSQLALIEHALSTEVIGHKESCIRTRVVRDLLRIIGQSQRRLKDNRVMLEAQKKIFQQGQDSTEHAFAAMMLKAKHQQTHYQQQLDLLKRCRDALQQRRTTLLRCIHPDHLERYREQVKQEIKASWTTLGIGNAIKHFFAKAKNDLDYLESELSLLDQEVQGIFKQYQTSEEQIGFTPQLMPPLLSLAEPREKLVLLEQQALASFRRLSVLLLSQDQSTRRFLNSIFVEVEQLFAGTARRVDEWLKAVLQPLIHYSRDKKSQLEEQVLQCKELSLAGKKKKNQVLALEKLLTRTDEKSRELQHFILRVQEPPVLRTKLPTA